MRKDTNYDLVRKTFFDLISKYFTDRKVIYKKWNKMLFHYNSTYRNVTHKLLHVEDILIKCEPFKSTIKHWDSFLFALYYYDLIPSVSTVYDKEKSREYCRKHMKIFNVPANIQYYTLEFLSAIENPQSELDRSTQYVVNLIMANRYKKKIS